MKDKIEFNFEDMPHHWAVCFNENCPLAGTCLRLLAGKHLPDDTVTWNTVLPGTVKDGHCPAFAEIKTERMAYGLGALLAHVEQKDFKMLKQKVMDYLGGQSTFYRYNRGEKLLSERQQAHIGKLLANHGYTGELVFGGYSERFVFSNIVSKNTVDA